MEEKIGTKVSVDEEIATFLKICNDKGNNLLHYVVQTDNVEFTKHLILAGCDVNKKNNENDPPLTLAIQENKLEMVRLLVNAGADYQNDNFEQMWGPLHNAALYGCTEIVKLLIEQGVDVNARTERQETSLQCACSFKDKNKSDDYCKIVKMLIDAGADMNAIDNEGVTPLVYAIMSKFDAGRELLLAMGANNSLNENKNFEFLRDVILDYDLDVLGQLIDFGADINYITTLHGSCLAEAAFHSRIEKVEFLLSKGARIDVENDLGEDQLCKTLMLWPFHNIPRLVTTTDGHVVDLASDKNQERYLDNTRCLNILIKHGANVNHVMKEGLTPLYIVLNYYKNDHDKFVQILLKNGAKFDFDHPSVTKVMKNTNRWKFSHLLLRHTAMFQAQNSQDGPSNFDINKLDNKLKNFYACCRDELESMKATKIDNTNVTFFNVLVNRDIGPYTRNENVKSAFEEPDITKCFPIYSDLLRERFSEEMEFQKLVEKAQTSLCHIFKWDRNSTHLLLDRILRYLNEKDLANLALI